MIPNLLDLGVYRPVVLSCNEICGAKGRQAMIWLDYSVGGYHFPDR